MVAKFNRELSETHAALYEEGQNRLRLQMELDARESEVEQLKQKVMFQNSDTASINSGTDVDTPLGSSDPSIMGMKNLILSIFPLN